VPKSGYKWLTRANTEAKPAAKYPSRSAYLRRKVAGIAKV